MKLWESIKAILKAMGVEVPADKEKDVQEQIDKLTQNPNAGDETLTKLIEQLKNDKSGTTNPLLDAIVKELAVVKEQNKNLTALLTEEKTNRENAISAQAAADKAAKEKKIADKIKEALDNKRIAEADKDLWKGRLEKDFDEWSKELDAKPVPKQFQKKEDAPPIGGEPKKTGNPILDSIAEHNQSAQLGELK